jgi:hypothetical protein
METSMHNQIAARNFSSKTLKALSAKGVRLLSTTIIPSNGEMPFANGDHGYFIDDNGTGRVLTHRQILAIVA